MLSAPIVPDPDGPPLRTYRWLRRIAIASAIVALALCVLRQVTMNVAERRWQAMRPALRAIGAPATVAELQPPAIIDEENAGALYRRAALLIAPSVESPRNTDYENDRLGAPPDRTPFWHRLADAAHGANASALADVRHARETTDASRADWGVVYRRPSIMILLPHLNDARALANVCADDAERDLLAGDSAAAIERVRDVLHHSRAVAARPFVVERLVANGLLMLAADALMPNYDRLTVGTGPRDAKPQQIRAILSDLSAAAEGIASGAAIANDSAFGAEMAETAADNAWLTRPIWLLDRPRLAQVTLDGARIARTDGFIGRDAIVAVAAYPAASWRGASAAAATTVPAGYRLGRPLVPQLAEDGFRRVLVADSRATTSVRAMVIALATRLYAFDHDGQLPPTLDALTPGYLPRVPVNPRPGDGSAFGYRVIPGGLPDGRDRMLLVIDASKPIDPNAPMRLDWQSTAIDLAPWPAR